MYTVKVVHRFIDTTCNPVKMREIGDIYDIPNIERLIELLGENRNKTKYVEFVSSKKPSQYKRTGKKVVFYQGYLYYIGNGVRQDMRLAKEYFGKACDLGDEESCKIYKEMK